LLRSFLEFLNNGRVVKGVNCTFIVIISKVDLPMSLSDYSSISLVGSIYKVLVKVLANQLSKVIGSVISRNQYALCKVDKF
jgi:hypothetical protein